LHNGRAVISGTVAEKILTFVGTMMVTTTAAGGCGTVA
jgi:hypothetical protein